MNKWISCLVSVTLACGIMPAETKGGTSLPRLVDLGATNCVACKKLAPILEELRKEYGGVFEVEFIDIWKKGNEQKVEKYKVDSIPTQVFLNAKGKELWRHVGFISKEDILAKWKELGFSFKPQKKKP